MTVLMVDPRLRQLWFGATGGLIAWPLHLVIGYVLISAACVGGRSTLGDALGLSIVFAALTLVLAAVAAGALIAAARLVRATEGWRSFLAWAGALLDALALGTILLGGSQVLLLGPCT